MIPSPLRKYGGRGILQTKHRWTLDGASWTKLSVSPWPFLCLVDSVKVLPSLGCFDEVWHYWNLWSRYQMARVGENVWIAIPDSSSDILGWFAKLFVEIWVFHIGQRLHIRGWDGLDQSVARFRVSTTSRQSWIVVLLGHLQHRHFPGRTDSHSGREDIFQWLMPMIFQFCLIPPVGYASS